MEADSRTSRGLIPDSGEGRTWAGIAGVYAAVAVKLVRYFSSSTKKILGSRNTIGRRKF